MEAWDHVHPKGSLADRPEPVAFRKASLRQEGAGHGDSNSPIGFDKAVLGLSVRGG